VISLLVDESAPQPIDNAEPSVDTQPATSATDNLLETIESSTNEIQKESEIEAANGVENNNTSNNANTNGSAIESEHQPSVVPETASEPKVLVTHCLLSRFYYYYYYYCYYYYFIHSL
jgi:hypothetical protein